MTKSLNICLFLLFLISLCGNNKDDFISDSDISQLLMVGIRGLEFDEKQNLHRDIKDYGVGGIILFDYDVPSKSRPRNISNPDQVKLLIRQFKNQISEDLLIAVDQEGGRVSRLKSNTGFAEFPSQQNIASKTSSTFAQSTYQKHAQMLNEIGFNINFAPVVDLNSNSDNPIIGSLERSYSDNPDSVIKYSEIAIKAFKNHNIFPVIKHFPGHGSSQSDSHLGVVDVSSSWNEAELRPFKELTSNNQTIGVMTAHIYNANIDTVWPATLSKKTINGLLRTDIGFEGIVFSDDLQMEAIRAEYSLETTIEQSLNAGVDILLFANNSVYDEEIVSKSINIIKNLINEGRISSKQVHKSIEKVKSLKESLNRDEDR